MTQALPAFAGRNTVDDAEIAKFSAMADAWWDPKGAFRPLHALNPIRLSYIRDHSLRHFGGEAGSLKPLSGRSLLDVGCGGGLLSEPLARMGGAVIGIDASEKNIAIAATHAAAHAVDVTYRARSAEALAAEGAQFDIVAALEIIEHVSDVAAFVHALSQLVRPGGLLFVSTLNRTAKSYLMAILGAEYILRIMPRGTHDWKKFLRPSEVDAHLRHAGFDPVEQTGMVLDPLARKWKLHPRDLDVNYIVVAEKRSRPIA